MIMLVNQRAFLYGLPCWGGLKQGRLGEPVLPSMSSMPSFAGCWYQVNQRASWYGLPFGAGLSKESGGAYVVADVVDAVDCRMSTASPHAFSPRVRA